MPPKSKSVKRIKLPRRAKNAQKKIPTRRSQRLLQKIAESILRENIEFNAVNHARESTVDNSRPQENPPAMVEKEEAEQAMEVEQPVAVELPRIPVVQYGDMNGAANQQQQQEDEEEDDDDGTDPLEGAVPIAFYPGNL